MDMRITQGQLFFIVNYIDKLVNFGNLTSIGKVIQPIMLENAFVNSWI